MAPSAPRSRCSGRAVVASDARSHGKRIDSGNSLHPREPGEGNTLSFGLYVIGFLIVIGGLVYGAVLLHVPQRWIVVGGVVLLGLAILTGVKATRQKDKAD
jgi:hypothetical protein